MLKLYFRGLENPIFPKERFQDFISTMSESQEERKKKKKRLLRVVAVVSERDRSGRGRDGGTLRFALKKKKKTAWLAKAGEARGAAHGSNQRHKGRWFTERESVGRVMPQRVTSPQNHCSDGGSTSGVCGQTEGGIY